MVSGMCAKRRIPFNHNPFSDKSSQVSRQERACGPGISGIDLNSVERFFGIEKLVSGGANRCVQLHDICRFRRVAFTDIFVVRRTGKNAVGQSSLEREAARLLQVQARGIRRRRCRDIQQQGQRETLHHRDNVPQFACGNSIINQQFLGNCRNRQGAFTQICRTKDLPITLESCLIGSVFPNCLPRSHPSPPVARCPDRRYAVAKRMLSRRELRRHGLQNASDSKNWLRCGLSTVTITAHLNVEMMCGVLLSQRFI
jgi:hypothetical protein